MITREMIKNGFENNLISIEDEYNGCVSLCCRIGNEAFYFVGIEDSYLSTNEYWQSYTLDMTIDMLYNILKDVEAAEENGLDSIELDYYESVLSSTTRQFNIGMEEKMTNKKRKYCMETIIPNLKNAGVTLDQLSEELDYRDRNGITEAREGWDDDLYFYSTEELEDAEKLWNEVA